MRRKLRRLFRRRFRCPRWQRRRSKSLPATPVAKSSSKLPTNQRADDSPNSHQPADVNTYVRERPGMSAFALEDGVVYHTYSTYARGLDGLWGMYQWLDRAPTGDATSRTSGGAATTN